MLELDHVFCLVPPTDDWAIALSSAGWVLDAGTAHAGQGTRNRRISWSGQYVELLWVEDAAAARANPLRLDLRADWARSGASPFGFGLRGHLPSDLQSDFWSLPGLPMQVWVHRDSDRDRRRPLVFVLDLATLPPGRAGGRTATGRPVVPANPGHVHAIAHSGPAPAALPPYTGPPITHTDGPHRLDVSADGGRPTGVAGLLQLHP